MIVLKKPVPGLTETALARFIARVRQAVGLKGAVNVLVTSNAELRALNRQFRRQDKPTDVLSFTAAPETVKAFAGDIAISSEMASHNARSLGHPVATEVKILALHGVLHLHGYDHEHDLGEMAKLEQRLRRKLRLPTGLIERTESSPPAAIRNGARRRRRT